MTAPRSSSGTPVTPGFGDGRVAQERRLDLDRPDPVIGDLDDLVGAPGEPDVAVLVDVGGVADVVPVGDLAPVVVDVPLRLAPQGCDQPGERPLDPHHALLVDAEGLSVMVDDVRLDPGKRHPGGAGLDREHRVPVRDAEDGAGRLRLPHVVDDRDAVLEDGPLQPFPGGGVQDLAAENNRSRVWRSCCRGKSSPYRIRSRIPVGDVKTPVTPSRSMIDHTVLGSG